MSELHWTGAALLLALATFGGGSTRRRNPMVSWADFACKHGLDESAEGLDAQQAAGAA